MSLLANKRIGSNLKHFIAYAKKEIVGVTTGIDFFDKKLLGLRGLVGILGEPKACKSTLLLQIAAYNAQLGNPVYIIDRENGIARITQRLLCYYAQASWFRIQKLEREKLEGWLTRLATLPIYVDVDNLTFPELQDIVDELVQTYPGKSALLMIDSLQAMPVNYDNLRSSIDEWLVNLDSLKLRHEGKLTIIMTVEKRRGTYQNAAKDSGKESGRIEYKLEQQYDMWYDAKKSCIIVECTLNRDGPSNVRVELDQVLEDPSNPSSFIFKLKDRKELDI